MNIFEKILAQAAGLRKVSVGDIVEAKIDLAMVNDITAPLTIKALEKVGVDRLWDSNKVVVIIDHLVPANTVMTAELHMLIRDFVERYGVKSFYDIGRGGVCHQVMLESGLVKPGQLIVGADSHTCTYGALGAFASGIGSTEMASVFATGELWFKVPEAIKISLDGRLQKYVTSKDIILDVIGDIGSDGATYKGIEFTGPSLKDLTISDRATLCNMTVEAGAKTGIASPDDRVIEYLRSLGIPPPSLVVSDEGASYGEEIKKDLSALEPMVSRPSSVDDVVPVSEVAGTKIDQIFLGSCTNGRLEDLRQAADILKGKKVHPGTRMIVLPASHYVQLQALKEGLIDIFVMSEAEVGNPNCGPCPGSHMGILAEGEVCLSTTNRNFIGRMGSNKSFVYLASPSTAAASAIHGVITDPREVEEN